VSTELLLHENLSWVSRYINGFNLRRIALSSSMMTLHGWHGSIGWPQLPPLASSAKDNFGP
jgi:hypothetical protein